MIPALVVRHRPRVEVEGDGRNVLPAKVELPLQHGGLLGVIAQVDELVPAPSGRAEEGQFRLVVPVGICTFFKKKSNRGCSWNEFHKDRCNYNVVKFLYPIVATL